MSDNGKNQEMLEQLKGADDKKKSKKQTNGDGHVLTPAEIKRQGNFSMRKKKRSLQKVISARTSSQLFLRPTSSASF